MVAKTPRLLSAEQRDAFARVPADLSERDLGRFYTLSARDLEIINRHRRPAKRSTSSKACSRTRRTFSRLPCMPTPKGIRLHGHLPPGDLLRLGTRPACQGGQKGVDAGLPPAPGRWFAPGCTD